MKTKLDKPTEVVGFTLKLTYGNPADKEKAHFIARKLHKHMLAQCSQHRNFFNKLMELTLEEVKDAFSPKVWG